MNGNLDKLLIETTKFLKVARILLILWVLFYVAVAVMGTLGIGVFGYGLFSKNMQQEMAEMQQKLHMQ